MMAKFGDSLDCSNNFPNKFCESAAISFGLEAKAAGPASQIIGYKKGSTAVHIFFCESQP